MDYRKDNIPFDEDEDFDEDEWGKPKPRSHNVMVGVIVAMSIIIALLLGAIAFVYFGGTELIPFLKQETTAEPTTEQPTTLPPTTAEPEPELVTVPDVVGLLEQDAYTKLNEEGVRYKVSRQFSDSVDRDYVISQSPPEGEIKKTDTVTLYISKGREGEIVQSTTKPKKTEKKAQSSQEDDDEDEDSEEKKKPASSGSGDYMLPGSDSRYISASELSGMSEQELNYALNEIYARHGRRFSSTILQTWFDSKSWYNGTISPSAFDESVLNKYERANIGTIVSYMQSKGYR